LARVGAPIPSTVELRPVRAEGAARSSTPRFQGARVLSEGSRLAPREAGGILDLAIEGLLARLGPVLALSLCLWLPFRQIAELLGLSGLDSFSADLYSLAWNALSLVPLGFTASVAASLVGDALVDRRAPVAAGLVRGLARAPGAVVLLLLTQIAALPLVFLCVAPYFLVQWLSFAAVPIYVLEGESLLTPAERARARHSVLAWLAGFPRRIARSLARSFALSRGIHALGRWVLLALVGQLVLGGVLELGAMALTYPEAREYLRTELGFGGAAAELALGSVAGLFTALSSCLRAALMVAFYLDLRVRREGFDLELALDRRAQDGADGSASLAGAT
jgi:hypothetical protein